MFVEDEMGAHTSLAPVYGYSPRGERVYLEVPRNRPKNTTLIASMSVGGMGECLAVEGATTKVLFSRPTSSGYWLRACGSVR